jgi:hypothetical protein
MEVLDGRASEWHIASSTATVHEEEGRDVTVIVSVKINDGIIMASDSASTFAIGQTYLTADKIVNLVKGLPIGIMVTGNGNIGQESIATLLKDLRQRLDGSTAHPWAVDRKVYAMSEIAERVREFLFDEKTMPDTSLETWMRLRLCGYSSDRSLAEVWEVLIQGRQCAAPSLTQKEDEFGPRWDGEYEALNRLLQGVGTGIHNAISNALGVPAAQVEAVYPKIVEPLYEVMAIPAMPVQDAIDLARFMVETTAGYIRFALRRQPKTVGGPVEIAAITKHEGFRWVQRRHFYPAALN